MWCEGPAVGAIRRRAFFWFGRVAWVDRVERRNFGSERLQRESVFPCEGGDPDWAPAFAGEHGAGAAAECFDPFTLTPSFFQQTPALPRQTSTPPRRRPGPKWETVLTTVARRYCVLSNWAPAFAGVGLMGGWDPRPRLRGGGEGKDGEDFATDVVFPSPSVWQVPATSPRAGEDRCVARDLRAFTDNWGSGVSVAAWNAWHGCDG